VLRERKVRKLDLVPRSLKSSKKRRSVKREKLLKMPLPWPKCKPSKTNSIALRKRKRMRDKPRLRLKLMI
jgi:hypothetical protein